MNKNEENMDRNVLITEINNAHTLYYSVRDREECCFDINLQSMDDMSDMELVKLFGVLSKLLTEEIAKH